MADKSWDNTGLLVDASTESYESDAISSSSGRSGSLDQSKESNQSGQSIGCKILLTIDLTRAVASEAIDKKVNMVLAYHPFIFRGLKSITPKDPQQRSLLQLIKNNISVYCPHTAVDSARGGVNDFLADELTKHFKEEKRLIIQPDANEDGCGMGRVVTLTKAVPLSEIVNKIKGSLNLEYLQVAPAAGKEEGEEIEIKTIAICAGSGGSVFRGVNADLFYTGELSHHEALYFVETGSSVVVCNHSNTERAFLKTLRDQLLVELPDAEIEISTKDHDPYQTW